MTLIIIIIIFDAHGQRPPLNKRSAAPPSPSQIWQTQSHQRASNMSNPIMAKLDMAILTDLINKALDIFVPKYEQSKHNKARYQNCLNFNGENLVDLIFNYVIL